ncbi:MAG TPA: hypothetical protein VL463_05850 [Kofleriaceae bacterium]|nr:hypothetical protein [Kofleriaceae bacterium]
MKRTLLAAPILLLVSTHAARAEDKTPLEKAMTELAYHAYYNPGFAKSDARTKQDMKDIKPPKQCFDAVAGAADDVKIYTSQAFYWKTAQKDDTGSYITGADAKQFCKDYEKAYVRMSAESAITNTYLSKDTVARPVEGMYESEASQVGVLGDTCAKAVDAALAYGFPATEQIESKFYDMPAIALGDAKAKICQPAIDWAKQRVDAINAGAKAKQDAIIAVYKKVGIKGKRLDLFVSYGMPADAGFYAAGCEHFVETAEGLKKAKKLFVWLEGNDGYTIRKFTFSGDNYTVTEHSYDTQAGAYSGCH